MTGGRSWALVLLLVASLAAGCIGGDEALEEATGDQIDTSATDEATDGATAATADGPLGPDDVIEGPDWEVGQWFGYHVFFGMEDDEGVHYNAVVTEDRGSEWFVATDNQDAAKFEAIFDLFLLGSFSKQDLSTTSEGEPFTWYEWPLEDNATWTAPIDVGAMVGGQSEVIDVTFTATYDPAIPTQDGQKPGFDIEGRTAEGNLTMSYDYVPHLGWFGHLFIYDPDTDGDDWVLHIMTMGSGTGWTGTYYVSEATELFAHTSDVGADPSGNVRADPSPAASGTVGDQADYVTGFAYAYAFGGAHETAVADPEGELHEFQAVGAPFGVSFGFLDTDAIPGDWHVATLGAGVAAGGGVFLWEITETTGQL